MTDGHVFQLWVLLGILDQHHNGVRVSGLTVGLVLQHGFRLSAHEVEKLQSCHEAILLKASNPRSLLEPFEEELMQAIRDDVNSNRPCIEVGVGTNQGGCSAVCKKPRQCLDIP